MSALRQQRTLAEAAVVEGFGYWGGQDVRVEFRPAAADHGVAFVRTDLWPPVRVPATVSHRVEAPRRSTLQAGSARVEMVEHVLAALAGLGIDNCEVCVDAAEMPGCDGSAQAYVEALDAAGVVVQDAPVRRLVVDRPVRLGDQDKWIEARPPIVNGLSVEFFLDYGSATSIGRQQVSLTISPDTFRQELACCRTFLLEEEAQWLVAQGLGTRVTARDLLLFGPTGPVDNTLRFADECARHKVLDVVGDLALAGCEIVGHIVGHRSGHQSNADLVKALLKEAQPNTAAERCA